MLVAAEARVPEMHTVDLVVGVIASAEVAVAEHNDVAVDEHIDVAVVEHTVAAAMPVVHTECLAELAVAERVAGTLLRDLKEELEW